jgi:ABC-2 type transport system ATP-binding protein
MRIALGLDRPTRGTALVAGQRVERMAAPLRVVGALLDAGAVHPGRTGRAHLRIAARSNGIPRRRVDEVIELAGLGAAAGRRVKGYSLGMRQRHGIAAALLGDPGVVLFDEPVNGLDLDGVRWIRGLLRELADEGRTVLVSSHLMSEMQQVADHLVVIGRGRLLADASIERVLQGQAQRQVNVRTPSRERLEAELAREGLTAVRTGGHALRVDGATAARVGDVAHRIGVPVHELSEVAGSLEQAYLELTESSLEYHGTTGRATAEGRA